MLYQRHGEAVRHVVANETETRYVVSNPFCDPDVRVRLRAEDAPPDTVADVKIISYPTGWHIALVFPEPPGAHEYVVEIRPGIA